jgi:hypothetical protein
LYTALFYYSFLFHVFLNNITASLLYIMGTVFNTILITFFILTEGFDLLVTACFTINTLVMSSKLSFIFIKTPTILVLAAVTYGYYGLGRFKYSNDLFRPIGKTSQIAAGHTVGYRTFILNFLNTYLFNVGVMADPITTKTTRYYTNVNTRNEQLSLTAAIVLILSS